MVFEFHLKTLAAVVLATHLFAFARGESHDAPVQDAKKVEEADPTKQLLEQLTIGMMEVIDERTLKVRSTSPKEKKNMVLRLGNTGAPARGALSEGEYAEKVNAAKAALVKIADKQALWYKAAPDNVQSSAEVTIADLWNKGGMHVNSALKKEGHLSDAKEYEYEFAKDILGAAAKEEKEQSYKKLGELMAEQQKEAQAKVKQVEDEEAAAAPFGIGEFLGCALVIGLLVGVATNFGKASHKRKNMNRRPGLIEQLWRRMLGQAKSA